jgi:hypothetical protein
MLSHDGRANRNQTVLIQGSTSDIGIKSIHQALETTLVCER